MFEKVVKLELEAGIEIKWRFKALEALVVLTHRLGDFASMVERHQEMLEYISKSSVTRNECTSAINTVLEAISGASADPGTLSKIYEITLSTLKQSSNNERLWFQTYVRYGKACLRAKEFSQLTKVVHDLHQSCQLEDGSDDPTKVCLWPLFPCNSG